VGGGFEANLLERVFMTDTSFLRAERLRLAEHPTFNNDWLRERIVNDASILGLGNLCLADEGRQTDGRLELLLRDPATGERFTVLVRNGLAEDGDLVRVLEQWTIERGRYPEHPHFAVVIAEQFAPRFLIAACAIGDSIPLSVMQFATLRAGERVVMYFNPVLDRLPKPRVAPANGKTNGNGQHYPPAPVSREVFDEIAPRTLDDDAWNEQLAPEAEISAPYIPRRRTRRNGRLFSLICVVSLLVGVALSAVWVRSYKHRDEYAFSAGNLGDHAIYSDHGYLEWILPAGNMPDGRERYVKVPYWLPIGIAAILPIAWLVRGWCRVENR
jgi:hypothetical protein